MRREPFLVRSACNAQVMAQIGSLVLNVTDIDRAAAFWRNALGYVPRAGDNPGALVSPRGKGPALLLDETDVKSVDFQKVDRTFRDAGLVPGHMVLENVPHFRLIAVDPHLCCGLCEGSATNAMKQEQARMQALAKTQDPSLSATTVTSEVMPAISVDRPNQRVTAEYYHSADVSGFRNALERAGFSPKEIRIEIL